MNELNNDHVMQLTRSLMTSPQTKHVSAYCTNSTYCIQRTSQTPFITKQSNQRTKNLYWSWP